MTGLFRGGIHPHDRKHNTAAKPIEVAPLPPKVIIPVSQHIGAPGAALVKKGDLVKKGQMIAASDNYVSAPVHASISGKVADVAVYPDTVKGKCLSVVIESDGLDEWAAGLPLSRNWRELGKDELLDIIRQAGLVGLGGATFPTHVKQSPPPNKEINFLILNGAECEPYLTADHRVMLEYADRLVTGTQISMKILGVDKGYIGIEDNKADAVQIMRQAFANTSVEVVQLPTRYPQGAEKMLIKAITGREVPSGGLPMDVGVVVQNVSTIVAICDAVTQGIPLIERVVTVTGSAVAEPKNLLLRIGTSFAEAVAQCGGFKVQPEKIIMGGPMMGIAQYSLDVPVSKGTSGIVALGPSEVKVEMAWPCIRCGSCVDACPMGLNPSLLSVLGNLSLYQEAVQEYHLLDCIECGTCAYVCPANRPIVQYIRTLKYLNANQRIAK